MVLRTFLLLVLTGIVSAAAAGSNSTLQIEINNLTLEVDTLQSEYNMLAGSVAALQNHSVRPSPCARFIGFFAHEKSSGTLDE